MLEGISRLLRREAGEIHPLFAENHAFFAAFDQDQPLEQYEFVVFDTELTGLNRADDDIVSIGAVRIRDLRIQVGESFFSHVRPTSLAATESTLIHQITPEELKTAPQIRAVMEEFIRFVSRSLLVGHYIGLDMQFVNRVTERLFHSRLKNPCLDTIRLAETFTENRWKNYYDQFNLNASYNLADLSRKFNLPYCKPHDAFEDAMQTAYLFLFLIKKLRGMGIVTLRDLFRSGQRWRRFF
ncbi:MAG: 3'-5' exonuclease [Thermodesulfobacteriota bacterium]